MKLLIYFAITQMFLVSCSEEKKTLTGNANIQLEEPSTSLNLASSPTKFKVSFNYVQLLEGMDDNGGSTGDVLIWLHPNCSDSAGCEAIAKEKFDMIDPVETNSVLNSQELPITIYEGSEEDAPDNPTKTFKYVRIGIGASSDSETNVEWGNEKIESSSFKSNFGLIDAVIDPPLILAEGDQAIVNVIYDLADTVSEDGDESSSEGKYGAQCAPYGTDDSVCFSFPEITATVTSQ